MTKAHFTETVLALPEAERLVLAKEIIASLASDVAQRSVIGEGVRPWKQAFRATPRG